MEKIWRLTGYDAEVARHLQEVLKIHPVFCQLLAQRKVHTFDEAKHFFRPQLSNLHPPFLMKNMDRAVDRVIQAVAQKEKILIYGDYDVDGTTSVAMLYDYLSKLHQPIDYYIPDRYREGYGISYEGIEYAIKNEVKLIITVDCGISANKTIKFAQNSGVDVIVCDHHLPKDELPPAYAILDPKQHDCPYPYKELSGCGVAFKLAQGINERLERPFSECEALLDYVVISIASDIVDITGENRILAFHGLQKLNNTERLGLKMLIKRSGKEVPLTISDIVFGIAPIINAAGRLADAQQAVRLLLANSKQAAVDLADLLERRNKIRREFDQRIGEEAKSLFQMQHKWKDRKSIVLYQPHWHKGVVGIVASRIADLYHRPTVILTESGGKIVGSARSVNGFNIHNAIQACEDLLINYGGHDFAAGLTLFPGNVLAFQDRFEAAVSGTIEDETLVPTIEYAAILDLGEIKPKFWQILQQFAPFGPGNQNPVFVSKHVIDSGYSKVLKDQHLQLSIKQIESAVFQGIGFGLGQYFDYVQSKKPFHIIYNIQNNRFQGHHYLQLAIKDLTTSNDLPKF